jgi:hypothetical protein
MQRLTLERAIFIGIILILIGAIGATTVMAAVLDTNPSENRKNAVEDRNRAFNRAQALYPPPKTVNFPMRKELVEFTKRQDRINHPWYVYVEGDNGNTIGYYVAKFAPESICNFLSSTEDVYGSSDGNLKMQSPSYDGVYYGACDPNSWFIFDYSTNALIVSNQKYTIADAPLKIDAQPIKVKRQ